MPIEIRELVIKTKIVDEEHYQGMNSDEIFDVRKERVLVEKCVQEVLKKLRRKIER